jgi:hypothetical protein
LRCTYRHQRRKGQHGQTRANAATSTPAPAPAEDGVRIGGARALGGLSCHAVKSRRDFIH